MLEWTGERFVPWVDDPALAYEHIHRYAFAMRFASGSRVLDLGSGEGYGAALLSRSAHSVVGVDIDIAAVRHAREKYPAPNLEFLCGSVAQVPLTGPFDLVVCFETLEHIEEQSALMAEARRLLAPDGILLVSTPDKRAYSDEPHHDNPFHTKELYFDEFRDLLGGTFPLVQMFAQRVSAGSRIWRIGSGNDSSEECAQVVVGASGDGLDLALPGDGDPLYYIAIAGMTAAAPAPDSVLVDRSGTLLEAHERTRKQLEDEIARRVREHSEALDWKDSQIGALNDAIGGLEEALRWRASQVDEFQRTREEAAGYVRLLESTISEKNEHIATVESLVRSETARADLAERALFKKIMDWIRRKRGSGQKKRNGIE